MEGLTRNTSRAMYAEKDASISRFCIDDSSLNDTNASEIQRILGSVEIRRGSAQEDRSSTQYLNVDGIQFMDR